MAPKKYPDARSLVTITYNDGMVQSVEISASHYILHHLVQEAQHSGMLVLRDDAAEKAMLVPVANIRNVEIAAIDAETGEMK